MTKPRKPTKKKARRAARPAPAAPPADVEATPAALLELADDPRPAAQAEVAELRRSGRRLPPGASPWGTGAGRRLTP